VSDRRRTVVMLGVLALLLALAVPALAAKPDKGANAKETPITVTGNVQVAKDAAGKDSYTLSAGGKTYTLEAGPPWFFGDHHALKPFVGKSVTIAGEIAEGSTEIDVVSVNGTALREPGKPPWAGGWKVVGANHPGWSQEKADRMMAKFGDCFPPGPCKDKPNKGKDAPKESAAP
jgi:hypothetical protein